MAVRVEVHQVKDLVIGVLWKLREMFGRIERWRFSEYEYRLISRDDLPNRVEQIVVRVLPARWKRESIRIRFVRTPDSIAGEATVGAFPPEGGGDESQQVRVQFFVHTIGITASLVSPDSIRDTEEYKAFHASGS